MELLKCLWEMVPVSAETIVNCFKKVGFLGDGRSEDGEEDDIEDAEFGLTESVHT